MLRAPGSSHSRVRPASRQQQHQQRHQQHPQLAFDGSQSARAWTPQQGQQQQSFASTQPFPPRSPSAWSSPAQLGFGPPPAPVYPAEAALSPSSLQQQQQLSAQLNSNMVANAARHQPPAQRAQLQALLDAPLSARVARAMRAHEAALAGDPLAHSQAQQAPATAAATTPSVPPRFTPLPQFVTHATSQLALPLEFVQQQQQKLFAQQQQQQRDEHKSPTRNGQGHARSGSSPLRSPRHLAQLSSPHYVAAVTPDIGYAHQKRRQDHVVSLLASQATHQKDRSAAVQLEMRGSVRFDTSNPAAIFDALKAQAATPVSAELDYNAKHVVRLKDGSLSTVFGFLLSRPDTVRDAALSQFFVQKIDERLMPSLERFASSNFARDSKVTARDVAKSEKHNKDNKLFERKARVERTDEELMQCEDDVLSPLERWKRDQLRIKVAKAEAQENALKASRARQNEALKLRLERERFEREEREAKEKEAALVAAREEEDRLAREAERLRIYRELVGAQAESNKQSKLDAELAKAAEADAARKAEEARRKRLHAEGHVASYMNPLSKQVVRTLAEEQAIARLRDAEKNGRIAQAKLKAEILRIQEMIRKRTGGGARSGDGTAMLDAAKDMDLAWEVRRLKSGGLMTSQEESKLKELERTDAEARMHQEKAAAACDAAEAAAQASAAAAAANSLRSNAAVLSASAAASGSNSLAVTTQSSANTSRKASAFNTPNASSANLLSPGGSGSLGSPTSPGRSYAGRAGSPGGLAEGDEDEAAAASAVASPGRGSNRSTGRSLKWDAAIAGAKRSSRPNSRGAGAKSPGGGTGSGAASVAQSRTGSRVGSRVGSRRGSFSATADGEEGAQNAGASSRRRTTEAGVLSPALPDSALSPSNTSPVPSAAEGEIVLGPDGQPELGPDGEPLRTYVNEKTLAIDEARQAMVKQQQDFEARIKALTSFSTVPDKKKGGGKKSGKKAAAATGAKTGDKAK